MTTETDMTSIYRGGNRAFMPDRRNAFINIDNYLDRFSTVSLFSWGKKTRYFCDGAQFE